MPVPVAASTALGRCHGRPRPTTSGPTTASAAVPGVTAKQIVVGSLGTQSGTLAGQFGQTVNGVEAYLDYVN
ncbi:MAG: hypothetical protein ACRDY1_11025, partial [Acidimicrobiales bacterium]